MNELSITCVLDSRYVDERDQPKQEADIRLIAVAEGRDVQRTSDATK